LLAQTPELAEFGIGSSDDIQPNPNWASSPNTQEF